MSSLVRALLAAGAVLVASLPGAGDAPAVATCP